MLDEASEPAVGLSELTAVDLFAGAGGSTQGLSDAGFHVIGAVENDQTAASTFSANHPSVPISIDDISKLDPAEYLGQLKLDRAELSLLTACPPCQGFSSLGSRDSADERNDLITEVWRFAAEMQPAAVLIENVPGLARDPRWEDLRALAVEHSYGFGSWIVDALDFGVPQRRRRLIGIAIRDRAIQFPATLQELLPTSFSLDAPHASQVIAQAGDISDTADPWHRARTPTPHVLERLRKIPAGGDHFDLPNELQLDCHKRLKSAGRTGSTGPYSRIPLALIIHESVGWCGVDPRKSPSDLRRCMRSKYASASSGGHLRGESYQCHKCVSGRRRGPCGVGRGPVRVGPVRGPCGADRGAVGGGACPRGARPGS